MSVICLMSMEGKVEGDKKGYLYSSEEALEGNDVITSSLIARRWNSVAGFQGHRIPQHPDNFKPWQSRKVAVTPAPSVHAFRSAIPDIICKSHFT